MSEVQAFAPSGTDRRDRGRDIAWNAEIVGMQMQWMRDFEIEDCPLQGLDDLARRETVERHDIVEAKSSRIVFECGRSAGIDAFDAEAIACSDGGCDVIGHGRRSFPIAQQTQQEIVVAEDGKRPFVDDRYVSDFELRLERLMP